MNMNCGFTTDLANGLTVSVQWHDGAYATRDDDGNLVSVEMACWTTTKSTESSQGWVESGGEWLTRDVWPEDCFDDDVVGYVPVMASMRMMDTAAQLPTDYVSLLATLKETADIKQETADIKQETERLKQEIEDLKQEKDNLERERAESYDGII